MVLQRSVRRRRCVPGSRQRPGGHGGQGQLRAACQAVGAFPTWIVPDLTLENAAELWPLCDRAIVGTVCKFGGQTASPRSARPVRRLAPSRRRTCGGKPDLSRTEPWLPSIPISGLVKVLLLTPAPTEVHRGPAATVARFRTGLQRYGHLCETFGEVGDGQIKESLEGTIGRFKPDLVHAHDAYRCGIHLLGLRLPWVVSVSGDDLYTDRLEGPLAPLVAEVLRASRRVLVPLYAMEQLIESEIPETAGKIDVVPRSAETLPTDGTDLRRSLGIPRHRVLILLPGGIRPARGQLRAVGLIRALRSQGVDAEMIIVGPEQDADYVKELHAAIENEPGIRVMPALGRERMGAAYCDADIVLNTSLHEAMSPTILEAGILGRTVVASANLANAELIKHKETGLLFESDEDMAKCCLALLRKRSAAGALGVRLREDLKRRFGPDQELGRLLSAYAAA